MAWRIPDHLEHERLRTLLLERFSLTVGCNEQHHRVYYDTHDWRLWRKNKSLFIDNGRWRLHSLTDDEEFSAINQTQPSVPSRLFTNDIEQADLRDLLAPIVAPRALLSMATLLVQAETMAMVNMDKKTVARLSFSATTFARDVPAIFKIRLHEIRGYSTPFSEVLAFIADQGAYMEVADFDEFHLGVKARGRAVLDYSGKFNVDLTEETPASTALKMVFRHLLATMQNNEDGILKDIDSEFLHDFRVAIRRTRSALSLFKGMVPRKDVEHFRREFAYMGRITGATRDLDVYLLKEEEYRQRLPPCLWDGLPYFFKDVSKRRALEYTKMIGALRAPRYTKIMQSWPSVLEENAKESPPRRAHLLIGPMARKIIAKRYHRILNDGGAIHVQSPDETLHRLRIQCKKLRYTIEFFSSILPQTATLAAVDQLKILQDNLGNLNDLSVQQNMLRDYLASISPGTRKAQRLSATIGGLLTNLYHQQQSLRNDFEATFDGFASHDNISLFNSLILDPQVSPNS